MLKPVQNEFLAMGYVAMSLGPVEAEKLFKKYTDNGDFRSIICYQDGSYRRTTHPNIVLDYRVDQKGTVVQQRIWQPSQTGDVRRHVTGATILRPVFFVRTDNVIGVDMSNARSSGALNIFNSDAPAPLGVTSTHFSLKWPGYAQGFKKQQELRDSNRIPYTMSKLVERVARFIERFIEEAATWPIDPNFQHWRVGPGAITKDHLYIVGLIHVSAGTWQPIIQMKHLNFH
ncbi:hypothetical protein PENSPDRAFT_751630 [Peniophora sp. CONT]|nr:hypothetical protein PENSPDRAFT_751630 [Peniophora sp. CONT]